MHMTLTGSTVKKRAETMGLNPEMGESNKSGTGDTMCVAGVEYIQKKTQELT